MKCKKWNFDTINYSEYALMNTAQKMKFSIKDVLWSGKQTNN